MKLSAILVLAVTLAGVVAAEVAPPRNLRAASRQQHRAILPPPPPLPQQQQGARSPYQHQQGGLSPSLPPPQQQQGGLSPYQQQQGSLLPYQQQQGGLPPPPPLQCNGATGNCNRPPPPQPGCLGANCGQVPAPPNWMGPGATVTSGMIPPPPPRPQQSGGMPKMEAAGFFPTAARKCKTNKKTGERMCVGKNGEFYRVQPAVHMEAVDKPELVCETRGSPPRQVCKYVKKRKTGRATMESARHNAAKPAAKMEANQGRCKRLPDGRVFC